MSFLGKLRAAAAQGAARDAEPWLPQLERLRGQIGDDGLERMNQLRPFSMFCRSHSGAGVPARTGGWPN